MNTKRKLELELKELINKKAKGAQIRSRAKWIDEGETNTAFFLKLESSHQNNNVIKCIKNRDQTVTNCSDILGEMCEFYT